MMKDQCHMGAGPFRLFVQMGLLWILCWGGGLQTSDVWAADKVAGTLWVQDVLTMPKKPVTLKARLMQSGLLGRTGLGGEVIEFFVGGNKIGTALTGGDGWALLEYTTRMRGNLAIRGKLLGSKRVQDTEATATLYSWEHRRPILLVELDALLKKASTTADKIPDLSTLIGHESIPAPLPDAPKELERLTTYYFNAVYVWRAPKGDMQDLSHWISQHSVPLGYPVIIESNKKSLEKLIEKFKKDGWKNIKGGIGRTQDFAQAFAEQRMKVVILSESGKDERYPRKTKWAQNWLEIRRQIQ